jgi:hypothetical protein
LASQVRRNSVALVLVLAIVRVLREVVGRRLDKRLLHDVAHVAPSRF